LRVEAVRHLRTGPRALLRRLGEEGLTPCAQSARMDASVQSADCSSARPDAGRVPEAHHHLPDAGPTPGAQVVRGARHGSILLPRTSPWGIMYIQGESPPGTCSFTVQMTLWNPLWPPYDDLYIKMVAKQN